MTDRIAWQSIPARIIVKPRDKPIFDGMATVIEVTDEAAGPFVRVTQDRGRNSGIGIDGPEWPLIREAIDAMMAVSQGLDAETLGGPREGE